MDNIAFVNLSHPNDLRSRKVQAGIRRHVMKEIGRSRRKQRRAIVISLSMRPQSPFRPRGICSGTSSALPQPQGETAYSPHLSWSLNPLGILGVDLDKRALEIVHFMKERPNSEHRPLHFIWIRMGLSDSTAFYVSLANTLLLWNREHSRPATNEHFESPESATYYFEALSRLSKRLIDPQDCMSVGVIAAIIGSACHDIRIGNWERWAIHMNGLIRIAKIRGGFDELENHIPLMAFWIDLIGSAVIDSPPWFAIPQEVYIPRVHEASIELQALLLGLQSTSPQLFPFFQALRMMSSVAVTVNCSNDSPHFWEDEIRLIHMLGPVTHQLLSLPRLSDSITDDSDTLVVGELVRLSCLMLLSGLKKRSSLDTSDLVPLQGKFSCMVARDTGELDWWLQGLRLWALITSALLHSSNTRIGLIPHIQLSMRSRGLFVSHATFEFARKLLWINALEEAEKNQLAQEIDSAVVSCSA